MNAKPRVVIVDDVPGLRNLLRIILEESELYEVVGEGADGLEGVMLAREQKPDAMLLDLSMPNMDGLEALPSILRASPRTKVLIFSGLQSGQLRQQLLDAGASDLLVKGASPTTILDRLGAILGRPLDPSAIGGPWIENERGPHVAVGHADRQDIDPIR